MSGIDLTQKDRRLKEHRVRDVLMRHKGVRGFGSALLRCELAQDGAKVSRPVLPDRELTKGGSVISSGCQQHARVMKLRYVAWWWRSRERKPTGFGNGFGRCLASVSTSRRGSE